MKHQTVVKEFPQNRIKSKRTMTIAEGLSKIKTIRTKIDRINKKMQLYSAWPSKGKLHPLGHNCDNYNDNILEAKKEVKKLYKMHEALVREFVKIKAAIDKANFVTLIKINGKVMTIHEALIFSRDVTKFKLELSKSINKSIYKAENLVDDINNSYYQEKEKARGQLTHVYNFIEQEKLIEIEDFCSVFENEFNYILNQVNAKTIIEIDE